MRLSQSYWPADRSRALLECTLGDALRDAAAEVPDRAALIEGTPDSRRRRRWTFSQLLIEAEQLAAALLERFEPGERVAELVVSRTAIKVFVGPLCLPR